MKEPDKIDEFCTSQNIPTTNSELQIILQKQFTFYGYVEKQLNSLRGVGGGDINVVDNDKGKKPSSSHNASGADKDQLHPSQFKKPFTLPFIPDDDFLENLETCDLTKHFSTTHPTTGIIANSNSHDDGGSGGSGGGNHGKEKNTLDPPISAQYEIRACMYNHYIVNIRSILDDDKSFLDFFLKLSPDQFFLPHSSDSVSSSQTSSPLSIENINNDEFKGKKSLKKIKFLASQITSEFLTEFSEFEYEDGKEVDNTPFLGYSDIENYHDESDKLKDIDISLNDIFNGKIHPQTPRIDFFQIAFLPFFLSENIIDYIFNQYINTTETLKIFFRFSQQIKRALNPQYGIIYEDSYDLICKQCFVSTLLLYYSNSQLIEMIELHLVNPESLTKCYKNLEYLTELTSGFYMELNNTKTTLRFIVLKKLLSSLLEITHWDKFFPITKMNTCLENGALGLSVKFNDMLKTYTHPRRLFLLNRNKRDRVIIKKNYFDSMENLENFYRFIFILDGLKYWDIINPNILQFYKFFTLLKTLKIPQLNQLNRVKNFVGIENITANTEEIFFFRVRIKFWDASIRTDEYFFNSYLREIRDHLYFQPVYNVNEIEEHMPDKEKKDPFSSKNDFRIEPLVTQLPFNITIREITDITSDKNSNIKFQEPNAIFEKRLLISLPEFSLKTKKNPKYWSEIFNRVNNRKYENYYWKDLLLLASHIISYDDADFDVKNFPWLKQICYRPKHKFPIQLKLKILISHISLTEKLLTSFLFNVVLFIKLLKEVGIYKLGSDKGGHTLIPDDSHTVLLVIHEYSFRGDESKFKYPIIRISINNLANLTPDKINNFLDNLNRLKTKNIEEWVQLPFF